MEQTAGATDLQGRLSERWHELPPRQRAAVLIVLELVLAALLLLVDKALGFAVGTVAAV